MSDLSELLRRASKGGAGLTKMQDLRITEVSGVGMDGNGPASQLDGWMVRKTRHQAVRKADFQAACKAAEHAEGLACLRAKLEELAGITPATKLGAADTSSFPAAPVTFIQKFRHGGSPLPILGGVR